MDPMDQMSSAAASGPIPSDFNAETAENMEDVRLLVPRIQTLAR